MFRRRTFSPSGIHYRVNIDKDMCHNPVDIYIDNDIYKYGFIGSYLDIYRDKKINIISINGSISRRDPIYEDSALIGVTGGVIDGSFTYEYNSGDKCVLAYELIYATRVTEFLPITRITDPDEIVNFTYESIRYLDNEERSYVDWSNSPYVLNGTCIRTDVCQGCEFSVIGVGEHSSYQVDVRIR